MLFVIMRISSPIVAEPATNPEDDVLDRKVYYMSFFIGDDEASWSFLADAALLTRGAGCGHR